jgi:hypothetical protein
MDKKQQEQQRKDFADMAIPWAAFFLSLKGQGLTFQESVALTGQLMCAVMSAQAKGEQPDLEALFHF